jgi:hypothetical protein
LWPPHSTSALVDLSVVGRTPHEKAVAAGETEKAYVCHFYRLIELVEFRENWKWL